MIAGEMRFADRSIRAVMALRTETKMIDAGENAVSLPGPPRRRRPYFASCLFGELRHNYRRDRYPAFGAALHYLAVLNGALIAGKQLGPALAIPT